VTKDDVITSIYDEKTLDHTNANQIFLFYKLYFESYIGCGSQIPPWVK